MSNTSVIVDLAKLYQKTFGSHPYVINEEGEVAQDTTEMFQLPQTSALNKFTSKGGIISESLNGVEIMLPVRLYQGPNLLMYLPYVVVKISSKKNIIKTPMTERKGTVKEQYSIDDYVIGIKGFLIGQDRQFQSQSLRS
ncbi:DUF6046 domain-containing protein [Paraflavitalea speifideaquila]|uniref:DUF6046 domain-containing protein n=1 Tax=Paraflavitalea speifideaquila TaxID=3076558 RepID=UPI0028E66F4C|nr:DUF6046 domain-containing protein [Paraflavitalea speifideiaquila]